jgi:hypothetical protein
MPELNPPENLMANWFGDFERNGSEQHLGLALAALTVLFHGDLDDQVAVEAVMAEVSENPLELFLTQTGLPATLIDVLASVTGDPPAAFLKSIALLVARRTACGHHP